MNRFGLGIKILPLFQVSNYSTTTVEVKCQSGYSGGLSQRFIMEVFETVNNSQVLVATNWTDLNVGNNQEVNLGVGGLLPDSDYIISVKASNERGESSPIYVGGSTRLVENESEFSNDYQSYTYTSKVSKMIIC